jgi:NADPH:quinone reductase-like Zn-dependent oxidoreductase/acyl carrier protein/NADP-dependent 3-hydroxy acid dehydrogenase YdfG
LNFRDVLNLLGRYPGEIPLGAECAGVVVSVGGSVEDFVIGDRVLAIAADCFANTVITPAVSAVKMPDDWSFVDGASVSVAYLTASVALESLARVRAGQKVLIHAAAGGVGLAAVSLCQSLGAEVFATASFAKHAYLNGLGISEVANSRSPGFGASILAATGGTGVDVVLNLLDESFVDENLNVLAPAGSYIDITKPNGDIAKKIAATRADVQYHCFDLADVIRSSPFELRAQLRSLVDRIHSKSLRKLCVTCFPFDSYGKAFRELQRAGGIGKIVVTQSAQPACVSSMRKATVQGDRAYVIVGGFGDLGLLTAQSLLRHGAGLVVLVGRREIDNDLRQQIESICSDPERLMSLRADASDRGELASVLDQVRQRMPIGGIIHSSGVLADAMVQDQTPQTIDEVFDSKARVALHLHQLTLNDQPHLFVMYSSLASALGAPGQSNHSAANSLLDSLADYRLAKGLPVTCIQWGPWSEIGEAARRGATLRGDLRGVGAITTDAGRAMIDRFLTLSGVRFAASPLNVSEMPNRVQEHPLLQRIRKLSHSQLGAPAHLTSLVAESSPEERQDWVRMELVATLSQVLGIDSPTQVGVETAFSELGVDSLTGIEFIDAVNRKLGIKLQTSAIYDHPNVAAMTRYVMPQVFPPEVPTLTMSPPASSPASDKSSPSAGVQPAKVPEVKSSTEMLPMIAAVAAEDNVEERLADLLAELNKWKS